MSNSRSGDTLTPQLADSMWQIVLQVLAGAVRPLSVLNRSCHDLVRRVWWWCVCAACVFPMTAAWHHLVFYRPQCMLNPFGPDYTLSVIPQMISRDPALPWAILTALVVFAAGTRYPALQAAVWPVPIAFAPVSIWIWDIPFSGRLMCRLFHDGRFVVLGYTLKTTTWYAFGLIAYTVLLVALYVRMRTWTAASSSRGVAFAAAVQGAHSRVRKRQL